MKLEFDVEGMMCNHCEKRVKDSVSKVDGVKAVKADHKKGKVTVNTSKEVESDLIKNAIEEAGYKVK